MPALSPQALTSDTECYKQIFSKGGRLLTRRWDLVRDLLKYSIEVGRLVATHLPPPGFIELFEAEGHLRSERTSRLANIV